MGVGSGFGFRRLRCAYGIISRMAQEAKIETAANARDGGTQGVPAPGPGDVTWDRFVAGHARAQFLQTSAWAKLKAGFGWQASRVALGDSDDPVAGASVLTRRVARLAVAYVPRGPVVDWSQPEQAAAMVDRLVAHGRGLGAAVLRVEPELEDSPAARQLLMRLGFRPSRETVQPPSTIQVNLTGGDDAVLQRMKSKWRYNIRLAERKGVCVRAAARDDLPVFSELMAETGTRDGFALHSPAYYAAAYDLLTPHHAAYLLAEFEGRPLAALVVVVCGRTAWYLWGASASRERNRMPNHALQWAAMQWAVSHGATRYDLWGIPDEIGRLAVGMTRGGGARIPVESLPVDTEMMPSDGLWGVFRFKQGFGGDVVRYVGTWDRPLDPVGARVFALGLAAQREVRAWRRRAAQRQEAAREAAAWTPVRDPATWRDTLAALPAPHVLQSWEWGQVKAMTHWRAERFVLAGSPLGAAGRPRAAYQLLTRRLLPGLPWRIGYVPKGPVIDWDDRALVEATIVALETHARRRSCIFLKIDPDVDEDGRAGAQLRAALARRGWRYSADQIQFKNTGVTDLRPGEDALLDGMKSKWRYNVRLAQRRGVTVRCGDEADLAHFYRLYAETGQRDGFLIRPYDYYRATWATFLRAEADPGNATGGVLLLAEHADEPTPVAGLFLMRYGDRAWYFYGASSDRRRRDMPNYLLQWEAIRWALARGCTVYDWWGAPTEPDDPADDMQGVWQFKQGFGAVLARHLGAWDFPASPGFYWLYTVWMPRLMAAWRRLRRIG